jgi:hypothetical protein
VLTDAITGPGFHLQPVSQSLARTEVDEVCGITEKFSYGPGEDRIFSRS